jgi:hypothetical protein
VAVDDDERNFLLNFLGVTVGTINDLRAAYFATVGATFPSVVTNIIDIDGVIAVNTGVVRWYNDTGKQLKILSVRLNIGTAPTGTGSTSIDVKKAGTTIFTSTAKPAVVAAGNTSKSVLIDADNRLLPDGSYLTVDVLTVCATTPGTDATVTVTFV